eukprot:1681250-Rhodomonas_salina.1
MEKIRITNENHVAPRIHDEIVNVTRVFIDSETFREVGMEREGQKQHLFVRRLDFSRQSHHCHAEMRHLQQLSMLDWYVL